MNVSLVLIVFVAVAFLAAGFVLGYAVALVRIGQRDRTEVSRSSSQVGAVQEQAAHWQAKAAEATGRAGELERENADLLERAHKDQTIVQMLGPLSARLQDMTDRVAAMQASQAAQDAALREQLTAAVATNRELAKETTSLRAALTSVSSRGTWGEVELRRIVEAAGMMAHVDFSSQQSASKTMRGSASQSDSASRPDLTVHLPGGAHVAVDAKVPLSALLRAQDIDGAEEGAQARRAELVAEHARALRAHVKELARRDYPSEFPGSPRITVLFLPAESLLSEALACDPSLLEDSLAQGITPATPSSLLALLRSIAAVWSSTRITEEAQAVLGLGRKLVQRLGTVAGHMDKLGSSLRSSVDRYNKTVASLESRVLVVARQFESLDVEIVNPRVIESDAAQVRSIAAPELASAKEAELAYGKEEGRDHGDDRE
ncbi:MAG: DNA recombination protein RmuC [Actinomycetaceae bacterium]|nr:DNA recombination protein RmuC [Actinomycetaceae bacterium]